MKIFAFRLGVIAFAGLITTQAQAGKSVGNGGNVVRCPNSISVLDTFEAQTQSRSWHFADELHETTFDLKVGGILQRLRRLAPLRAALYEKSIQSFRNNVISVEGVFKYIEDSGFLHARLPLDCSIQQVAVQVPSAFDPTTKELQVDQELFDLLSLDEQVALYFHEAITSEAVAWGAKDSSHLRPFTALLVSDQLSHISNEALLRATLEAGLMTYEAHGYPMTFRRANGTDHLPTLVNDSVRSGTIVFGTQAHLADNTVRLKNDVLFDENGDLQSAFLATRSQVQIGLESVDLPSSTRLTIDKSGYISEATYEESRIEHGCEEIVTDQITYRKVGSHIEKNVRRLTPR